jgi:hypothetical protein
MLEREEERELLARGARVAGTVIARDSTGGRSPSYHLSYAYEIGPVRHESRRSVSGAQYRGHAQGAAIEVVVDPHRPARSVLECERARIESPGAAWPLIGAGAGALAVGLWIWIATSRTRRLWLTGEETTADLTSTLPARFVYHAGSRRLERRAGAGPFVYDGERIVVLFDPARPERAMAVTPSMLPASRLEEALGLGERRLPEPPRADSRVWRKRIRPTAASVFAAILAVAAAGVAAVAGPQYVERREFVEQGVPREGRVVGRSTRHVEYASESGRGTFSISTGDMVRYPVGSAITVYRLGDRVRAAPELSTTGAGTALWIGAGLAAAAVAVALAGVRAYWRGRFLWRHGMEVHAAVVSDHTNKGQRHVTYRYAVGGRGGRGSRSFDAGLWPVGVEGPVAAVVVLVDPENVSRSRLVLTDEVEA